MINDFQKNWNKGYIENIYIG